MKTKKEKTFTISSDPTRINIRIKDLEKQLKFQNPNLSHSELMEELNDIKAQLRALYRLRHNQKNYTPPPRKLVSSRF